MTGLSVLLLGIGLGIRHATDADHMVVVSALVQREPSVWRAARIAALWGLGHTVAFLTLGLVVVLLGVRPSQSFERRTEILAAIMLIGFGVWHLVRKQPTAWSRTSSARPLVIGMVHGLAGSAGVGLLTATTISSRLLAVAYLSVVALGTVIGMVALTVVLARPISWTMRQGDRLRKCMSSAAALLSVALGVWLLVQVI
jgi:nickel/cobalt transporter (NicO) family protein